MLKNRIKRDAPEPILYILRQALRLIRGVRMVSWLLLHRSITIGNSRFSLPFTVAIVTDTRFEIEEKWMEPLIATLPLGKKSVFLDIGANVGQTLLSAKAARWDIEYVGFEPNPACVLYIRRLIRKNRIRHAILIPAGLSDKSGIADLWIKDGGATSSGSTLNGKAKSFTGRSPDPVPLLPLDTIFSSLKTGAPEMIKIDVEAHEPEVLAGSRDIIQQCRPLILIEVLPPRADTDSVRLAVRDNVQQEIIRLGYAIYRIKVSADHAFDGIERLATFPRTPVRGAEYRLRDYLLVPNERTQNIDRAFFSNPGL